MNALNSAETVTIRRLGHLGDGIADGPIFVPRALPGEVVSGLCDDGRMSDPRILTPSPDRVRPPCPHYRGCGGCAVQHASDAFVAGWKIGIVREALAAQGLEAEISGIATSPPMSRRRATFSGRRTKKGANVGFHAPRSDRIVDVPECQLVTPAIRAALPALTAMVRLGGSRKGELSIVVNDLEGGLDVAARGGKPLDGPLAQALGSLAREAGFARLSWDGEIVAQERPPVVRFGQVAVTPPPGAFLQATAEGEAALAEAVRAALGQARRVVDLFAGCGTFSFRAAEQAAVHAVEGDGSLIAALEAGARHAPGLKPITAELRDLYRNPLLAEELSAFDAAIVDPPRAGAESQVAEIARSGIERVAMVSCSPVTFARDVRRLTEAGFRVGPVTIVDQFRWSAHVELVAALERAG